MRMVAAAGHSVGKTPAVDIVQAKSLPAGPNLKAKRGPSDDLAAWKIKDGGDLKSLVANLLTEGKAEGDHLAFYIDFPEVYTAGGIGIARYRLMGGAVEQFQGMKTVPVLDGKGQPTYHQDGIFKGEAITKQEADWQAFDPEGLVLLVDQDKNFILAEAKAIKEFPEMGLGDVR